MTDPNPDSEPSPHAPAEPAADAPAEPAPAAPAEPVPDAPAEPVPDVGAGFTPALDAEAAPAKPEPTEAPAPPSDSEFPGGPTHRRSWFRRGIAAGLILVTAIALGPWLISQTVLTSSVRGSLRAGLGEGATLSHAGMGWRDGFQLERLLITDPPAGLPKIMLGLLHVDTDLVDGLLGVATGNEVGGRMIVRHARFELNLPLAASPDPAPEDAPESAPDEAAGEAPDLTQLPDLPCSFRPQLELEDLDFVLGWAPEGATPLKVMLLGLSGGGGGLIARDLALDLDQGIDMVFEEIVVESRPADGPVETLLWIEKPHFTATRLEVPSPRLASPLTATTALRLEVPRLRVGDVEIRDAVGTANLSAGVVVLGLSAHLPIGVVSHELSIDVRDDARWPISVELGLDAVGLEGDLARTMPYLVPLLLASETPTGPGLPPLTLSLQLEGAVVFGSTGAVDAKASLNSLAGAGEFTLAPGSLANSRLIDGYARALIGLGVFGLVDGVFPSKLEFEGASGGFSVGDGKVVLPRLELRSDRLGLVLSGETRFDGSFFVNLKSLPGEGQSGGVWDLLRALDDAGGVTLRGSLLDGSLEPVLPDVSKLVSAAQARGVLDLLQKGVGADLRGPLQDALGALGKD